MGTRCVIGIGCDDHGDQAAGLLVVRMIAARALGAVVHEVSGDPRDVVSAWSSADEAVVVEALPGAVAGTARWCRPHPLRPGSTECSSTPLSLRLRDALQRGPLPSQVTAITIAGRCFAAGSVPTPAVVAAAHQVADEILADALPTDPAVVDGVLVAGSVTVPATVPARPRRAEPEPVATTV